MKRGTPLLAVLLLLASASRAWADFPIFVFEDDRIPHFANEIVFNFVFFTAVILSAAWIIRSKGSKLLGIAVLLVGVMFCVWGAMFRNQVQPTFYLQGNRPPNMVIFPPQDRLKATKDGPAIPPWVYGLSLAAIFTTGGLIASRWLSTSAVPRTTPVEPTSPATQPQQVTK